MNWVDDMISDKHIRIARLLVVSFCTNYNNADSKIKSNEMQDYTWSTENSHSNNTETMTDYIHNHLPENMFYLFINGSYAEAIDTATNNRWGLHSSGNGDFNNHRVRFELLS